MTSAFALPILLDPRVNNIPFVMGLTQDNYTDFASELHELHYKWYLTVHATRLRKRRLLASQQPPVDSLNEPQLSKPEDAVKVEVDMGWDNFRRHRPHQPTQRNDVAPVSSTQTNDYMCSDVPMDRHDFREKSKVQYEAYLDACLEFPWAATYPKAQVGKPGVRWQVNLADEDEPEVDGSHAHHIP